MTLLTESTETSEGFYALFGLCFLVFGWFALALSLGNFFYAPLLIAGAVLLGGLSIIILRKHLRKSSWDAGWVLLGTMLFAGIVGYFSTPSVFTGRDYGSIAEAALRLAQYDQLTFATPVSQVFFDIYGPGTALNFPGFAYTESGELVTQFPLAPIAWLGSFVSFFGLSGLTVANILLLVLWLSSLYRLLRLFLHPWYAVFGWMLALTSFLPIWIAKLTLTENLAVWLFTSLLYYLFLFLREEKFIFYAGIFLAAGLLAFTRTEGFAFLAIVTGLLVLSPAARALWKTYPIKSFLIPVVFFVLFFIRDLSLNLPYYKMIGKAGLKFTRGLSDASSIGITSVPFTEHLLLFGSVLLAYGLLFLFLAGMAGGIVCAKEKRYRLLLPILIALPTFAYFIAPNITPDHPWMLRRYFFSVYPTLLFYALVGTALLFDRDKAFPLPEPRGKRRFFVTLLLSGLMILQLPSWTNALLSTEHATLLAQTEVISKRFSEHDLVLVDRLVTGSGFAMITGPLHTIFNKNAAYFFNPADLDKLNRSAFGRTYLLVPQGEEYRYLSAFGDQMALRDTIVIHTEQRPVETLGRSGFLHVASPVSVTTVSNLYEIY